MFPVGSEWHPKLRKKKNPQKTDKKPTVFRRITSKIQSGSFTYPGNQNDFYKSFQNRRQKPIVPVGMFLRTKSSFPDNFSKPKSPEKPQFASEPSEFPGKRKNPLNGWDFSDISEKKPEPSQKSVKFQKIDNSIPAIRKLSSEDEETSKIPSKIAENTESSKNLFPWEQSFQFDDISLSKPKKAEKIVENSEFLHKIERFSRKLEKIDNPKGGKFKKLSLQNESSVMLGDVEIAIMAIGKQKKTAENREKCAKVHNLILERSDWLIYREELDDDEDYLPMDPFYSTDAISNDFEEYEQEIEESKLPKYLTHSELTASEDNRKFLESIDNLDSQEDFFTAKSNQLKRANSEKIDNFFTSPPRPKMQNFTPRFADFCENSDDSQKTAELVDTEFQANLDGFDNKIEYRIPGSSSRFAAIFDGFQVENSPKFSFY